MAIPTQKTQQEIHSFRLLAEQNNDAFLEMLLAHNEKYVTDCVPEYIEVVKDILAQRKAKG